MDLVKTILIAYLAAIWVVAHLSLISCTKETCVIEGPSRELVPEVLLNASDHLLRNPWVNVRLLHLIGEISLLADIIIIGYLLLSSVLGTVRAICNNIFFMMLIVIVTVYALAIHQFGFSAVLSWTYSKAQGIYSSTKDAIS